MIIRPGGEKTNIFLSYIEKNQIPERFIAARPIIEKQYNLLIQWSKDPEKNRIYGVNTLVGHLDNTSLNSAEASAFQRLLINNHALQATNKYFDSRTSKHITFSRAWFYSLGGGGISLTLYDILLNSLTDEGFNPQIPEDLSYSCGDVIPGANWARALMEYAEKDYQYVFQPKEGLSLMNGIFVQVGAAMALVRHIQALWKAIMQCGKINAILCNANHSNYSTFLSDNNDDPLSLINSYIRSNSKLNHEYFIQDPVSIRSFPQAASGLHFAINGFFNAIETALTRRSDNPLISDSHSQALSQGSFIMTELSLASSQVVDALLMIAWISDRRLNHILSGKVKNIPANFSFSPNNLEFIQLPKMVAAILENMRKYAGIKTFSSGSTTSYGTEDFWSFGLQSIIMLREIINDLTRILTIELVTYSVISQHTRTNLRTNFPVLTLLNRDSLYENFELARKQLWEYYNNESTNH